MRHHSQYITFALLLLGNPFSAQLLAQQATCSVNNPADSQVFHSGDNITVSVTPLNGISLQSVAVVSTLGFVSASANTPIQLKVPPSAIGPVELQIFCKASNAVVGTVIRQIRISPPIAINTIYAAPAILDLAVPGTSLTYSDLDAASIRVRGELQDGTAVNLLPSQDLSFQTMNPLVATVDSQGTVKAVNPGVTSIVISNAGKISSVVVKVNIFDRRGDLDGNEEVDAYDLAVLLKAVGSAATGPDDPRDLNGDGVIDSKDVDLLKSLCVSSVCLADSQRQLQPVNAASFLGGPLAPGSLFSIFGAGLADQVASAKALPLPPTIANVSLSVNGAPAPLLYVSPTQINAQLPYGLQPGPATLAMSIGGTQVASETISVAPAAPGLFILTDGRAIIQNQDYTLNGPTNPAKVGSTVIVYFIGQGEVTQLVRAGDPAPASPLAKVVADVSATIGGLSAPIQFAGLTPGFAGLAQANVQIPKLQPGDHPLQLIVGNVASNSGSVSVQ